MKRIRFLIVLLCVTLGLGMLTLAVACKPEASGKQTATLTLSAGEGGTLAQTTYEVEVGTSLSDYLKNIAPTPEEGLTFAGWYYADAPLGSEKMPEGGYSLTAKYNATYTVNVYLENVDGTYGEPKTFTASSVYGAAFSYAPAEEHFVLDEGKENRLSSEKLGKGETFTAYMKRETYSVYYFSNAPEGEEIGGDLPPVSVRYGETLKLSGSEGFSYSEYLRFAGWANEADGALVYRADDEVTLEASLYLYAVWDHAYFDRFGGGDFLFFPQAETGVAILRRAGKEYRGEILNDSAAEETFFSFKEGEREILKGKANKLSGTFMYYREGMEEETYRHFNVYKEEFDADGATIRFDNYGNGTYTVGGKVKQGEISYDPSIMCYTFEGDGEHFDFVLTDVLSSDNSSLETVFATVGAEAGVYLTFQFFYEEISIKGDIPLGLILDGLGNLRCLDANTEAVLYAGTYEPKENGVITLTMYDADGATEIVNTKLLEYLGQKINVFEDGWAGTYSDPEGNTLTLDGFSGTAESAVWIGKDGTEKKGMYAFDFSFLGTILRLQEADGHVTSYRISIDEKFSELGDGSYTEYFLYNGSLRDTILLLGKNDTATLHLYSSTSDEKIEGKTTKVEGQKDLMLFTSTDKKTVFEFKLYGDYFRLSNSDARIYCHYFTYYPVFEKETAGAAGVLFLESKDGDELILDPANNAAVHTSGDTSTVGQFVFLDTLVPGHTYIEFYDYETGKLAIFEYSRTNSSFITFGGESGIYDWYNPYYGADDTYELILFDGEDGKTAIYRQYLEEQQVYAAEYGTYTYDEKTSRGVFTPDPAAFKDSAPLRFELGTDGFENKVFFPHNELPEDDITFAGATPLDVPLVLDAYGLAMYRDSAGNNLVGNYFVWQRLDEDVYRIFVIFPVDNDSAYESYIDIDLGNKTYIICDDAIGSYYEDINREDVLAFDGRGTVTRYNIHETYDNGYMKPLETGTYQFIEYDEDGRAIISVKLGAESYFIRCYYLLDDEGDAIGHYTKEIESAGTYVSDKWEYLTINMFGDAVYTDEYGVSYMGEVTQYTVHVVSFQGEYAQNAIYCKLGADSTFTVPKDGMIVDGDILVKYLGSDEKDIKIPDGVKKIAPLAFSEPVYGSAYLGAEILSLDLNEVEEIGENAFNGCWLLKSVKGAKLKKVGENAFYACIELSQLDLPALEEIGEMAFRLCESLTKVELKAAKIVYSSAFSECSELTEISLPAAEKLYEGVFYDCFALELVTLGANLTQLGTPDEVVAGVFGRDGAFEQSPLKVVLGCTTVPTVGKQLFENVISYTVVVPDIATVKAFYLAEGWADYNTRVGCASNENYFGTYYGYRYGDIYAFVLNETVYEVMPYSLTPYGAYEVRGGALYTVTFDQYAENKYTEKQLFTFDAEGNLVYNYYGTNYTYFKAGKEFTLHIGSDTVVFAPGEFTSLAAGVVYEVSAKWTKDGTQKDARVQLSYDQYFNATMYLKADGDRCKINSISTDAASGTVTASLGTSEFDPIITRYTAPDESILAVSQNDREGTEYTVSFILAAFRDENNVPFNLAQIAVEKGADGKTFTAKESYVFAGYSYKLTFTVSDDGTFSYTYVRDRQIVVESEDKSAKVVVYQAASGEVTSVTLFIGTKEVGEDEYDIKNFVLTHDEKSKVYRWVVYDYSNAGSYTFTFTGEGATLSGVLSKGTVVKGDHDGVFVIAFYEGSTRTALYMRGMDGEYGKVEDGDIQQGESYLTVVFKSNTYYVTLDPVNNEATIVFADVTYQSSEYSDIQGTVRVVKNPDGTTKSVTLTVEGKEYTQFTEYPDENDPYWVMTNGTDYYYVTLSTNGGSISLMKAKTCTADKLQLTLLSGPDGALKDVVNATYDGKEVKVNFFPFYDYDIGDCAWLEIVTAEGTKYFYHADVAGGKVETRESATLTTEDGAYRVTVIFENDQPATALHLEVKQGESYVELPISWCGAADYGDGYNFEIDDTDYNCYYFNIVKVDGEWSITLHHRS